MRAFCPNYKTASLESLLAVDEDAIFFAKGKLSIQNQDTQDATTLRCH